MTQLYLPLPPMAHNGISYGDPIAFLRDGAICFGVACELRTIENESGVRESIVVRTENGALIPLVDPEDCVRVSSERYSYHHALAELAERSSALGVAIKRSEESKIQTVSE